MKFRMMVIELPVPADVDPSEVLERMHALMGELAEENPDVDDEGDEVELDDETKDTLENLVSVTDKGEIKIV